MEAGRERFITGTGCILKYLLSPLQTRETPQIPTLVFASGKDSSRLGPALAVTDTAPALGAEQQPQPESVSRSPGNQPHV